ncbi:[acyl-carrier-protein] S-malonyltransferase [Lachnospiraceae bacterium NE2001]|nr:[acyl-carrier-protein] S-malonyltransferase [Lachnospiraceae bacterium NE2001]
MKVGFLYAGQGSQKVGMGLDLYEKYPEFKETFDNIKGVDFDLKKVCFEGPEETLNETKYTQPCMVAFAVGMTKVLKGLGVEPDMAAGLSLGEYSALYAAGVFTEEQVIPLVQFRGNAMQTAVQGRDCKMIAVLGLDKETIFAGCDKVREQIAAENKIGADGKLIIAEPANFNCPGQITVSGDSEAVDMAAEVFKEMGAKRCLPVKVSGPFHTSLMKPAGDALAERFKSEDFGEMQFPVYFNCIGREMDEAAGETIPALLEQQVQKSVYFDDTIKAMAAKGVNMFVEIGPGKTLSKFVQKTAPDIPVYGVETVEDIEKFLVNYKIMKLARG